MTKRSARIGDEFVLEEVNTEAISFAPDGKGVVFTRRRSPATQRTNGLVIPETRDDVWLQDAPGRPARNLTRGASDSSGWWAPRWSPNGQRLAMLSSRGGTVQLWVWERANGQVRPVTRTGVDYAGGDYRWSDDHYLVYAELPVGIPATPIGRGGYFVGIGVERAESAWANAKRGEVTASAVNSLERPLPSRRLMRVNVAPNSVPTLVGETSLLSSPGGDAPAFWDMSPDAKVVALRRPTAARFSGFHQEVMGHPAQLELRTMDGREVRLERSLPTDVVLQSLRWSGDGKEIAFFALEERPVHPELLFGEHARWVRYPKVASKEYPGRLWRVHLTRGTVEQWPTGDLDLGRAAAPLGATEDPRPTMSFTSTGDLLVHGARRSNRPSADLSAPAEWLVLSRDGRVRSGAERLRSGFSQDSVENAQRQAFARRVTAPTTEATLIAFSAQGNSGIYRAQSRKGLFLWRLEANGAVEPLVTTNTFLQGIGEPERRLITYRDLRGKTRKAVLTLPYGYKPGQRVPLVLDSDTDYTDFIVPERYDLASSSVAPGSDAARFAAAGYGYLWASMPTDGMGEPGRSNLLQFTDGILPAVEEVVREGFVDQDRVFLYGMSSMGYGVIGLVTQTARFAAAVAEAGRADQMTFVNEVNHIARFSPDPFGNAALGGRRGLPVWQGGGLIQRNSPLSYVDRVQTPLMIIHGEMDTPISSLERFFAALVQQRKPAQFVRYWAEGHGNRTPANVRDQWRRMLAWYDEWGDISRDADGAIVFENGRPKSRLGAPPLPPEAYDKFELFQPGGDQAASSAQPQARTPGQ